MTTTSPETDKTVQPLTRDTMKPGGRYNWKNQPDRLVYLGRYGGWHQFRKIGDPRDVWCEVLDADLHMLEETRVAPQAAPAPEPSAQGEPVAALMRSRHITTHAKDAVDMADHFSEWGDWLPTTYRHAKAVTDPSRNSDPVLYEMQPLYASPPPAVVEAVPQAWPIERAADMLTAYAELVKATGRYAEEHYIPEIENVASELRGIAPKAAQPQEKREPWLCLLCKSDRPGHHGLLDDRVTPCPDGAPKAAQQWANVPFKPETWQPDADGFTPDLCTECGTPVRYGSRHSKCAPKAAQEPRDA